MKNQKQKPQRVFIIIGIVISLVLTTGLDYLWPAPWNIHSVECWFKVLIILFIYAAVNLIMVAIGNFGHKSFNENRIMSIPFVFPVLTLLFLFIGALTGAQIFHSEAYANLISVEQIESGDAILSEEDAGSIALMDTTSAKQLGDREIGAIKDFSAFNVSEDYIQLNIQGDAVKVSPLEYTGLFKWSKNKDKGVTGYVSVSPTTMTADYVELEEGMKYIPSAYFSWDLNRHLHKQFPTLIYGNSHFEVDEDGKPYYVSSVYEKKIGLFSGEIVTGAIITNPISGESEYYEIADIPTWVDYVFPGELICDLYNVAYKNVNGYWNGTFLGANTNCMQTTTITSSSEADEEEDYIGTDYGYIAKGDDIYIYTGVTSMAADSSNLGFIMVNERTGEYKYFAVSSANEQSAMNAAEGEVQQYGYQASFPTLVNVDNELSYIGVLKDNSNLVKMYYMVNVKDYGKVAVAETRENCVKKYADKLGLAVNQDILGTEEVEETEEIIEFVVSKIQYIEVSGNTYVYLGTADGQIYKSLFSANEQLLFAKEGDLIRGTLSNDKLTVESVTSQ